MVFCKSQAAQAAKAAQAAGRPQKIKKVGRPKHCLFMLQVFIGMHLLAQISHMRFQRAPSGGFGSFQEAPQDTPGSVRATRTPAFSQGECMPAALDPAFSDGKCLPRKHQEWQKLHRKETHRRRPAGEGRDAQDPVKEEQRIAEGRHWKEAHRHLNS